MSEGDAQQPTNPPAWAPPAAPPFGGPSAPGAPAGSGAPAGPGSPGTAGAPGAPGTAGASGAPGASSSHYAPGTAAPPFPAAGAPPVGGPPAYPNARYAPPVLPGAPTPPAAAPAAHPRALGVVAFIAGLVAVVGSSLAGAVAAWRIGFGAGSEMATRPFTGDFDWALLSPVRDAVLAGEIAFWVGTALGVWALAQGIVAIVRSAGRGFAIAAVGLAALGPIAFFTAVQIGIGTGLAAGSGFAG